MKIAIPLAAAAILLLSGCSESSSPTGPDTARLGAPFRLSPGESASIEGEPLRIRFERVRNDDRCPVTVQCFWAGAAGLAFSVEVQGAPPEAVDLVVSSGRSFIHISGYEIEARRLLPDRQSFAQRIDQKSYRAELLVTK
jgi:hypothetical protein